MSELAFGMRASTIYTLSRKLEAAEAAVAALKACLPHLIGPDTPENHPAVSAYAAAVVALNRWAEALVKPK